MSDWRDRLKRVIEDRNISLPQLALQANYDYVTFWKALVKEKHTIKRETMNRLCQVLQVDPDYIWNGHGSPSVTSAVPLLSDKQVPHWLDGDMGREGQQDLNAPEKIPSTRAFAWMSRNLDMNSVVPMLSTVFFNPDLIPENNDLVLALYHGGVLLRRYAVVASEVYLVAGEPGFHAFQMGPNDRVLAVSVGFYHKMPIEDDREMKPQTLYTFDLGSDPEASEEKPN